MPAARKQFGHVTVGTSGYVYDHWSGIFYPPQLPKNRRFEYFASQFDSVELNATFYRLFPEKTFIKWADQAPDGFIYAVKLWRWITHRRRLKNSSEDLKTFLLRSALLKEHLGPVLIQLPPGLHQDESRLRDFLETCNHIKTNLKHPFRFAVEFRHKSWFVDEIYDLLRGFNVGLVLPDMPKLYGIKIRTADFIYIRFHGRPELYYSLYSSQALSAWARWLRPHIDKGTDVYAYFNNDGNAHATENALMLRRYLSRN